MLDCVVFVDAVEPAAAAAAAVELPGLDFDSFGNFVQILAAIGLGLAAELRIAAAAAVVVVVAVSRIENQQVNIDLYIGLRID